MEQTGTQQIDTMSQDELRSFVNEMQKRKARAIKPSDWSAEVDGQLLNKAEEMLANSHAEYPGLEGMRDDQLRQMAAELQRRQGAATKPGEWDPSTDGKKLLAIQERLRS